MAFVLEAKNISKRYGKVGALENIDLQLEDREILALVGDNGAGKSTLIKVLAGAVAKDSGEIYIDGNKVEIDSPSAAKQLGIEVVYQDLALINHLNVAQNLFLGREVHKHLAFLRVLDHKEMERQAREKLSDLGVRVKNIKAWVAKLSGGQRQ